MLDYIYNDTLLGRSLTCFATLHTTFLMGSKLVSLKDYINICSLCDNPLPTKLTISQVEWVSVWLLLGGGLSRQSHPLTEQKTWHVLVRQTLMAMYMWINCVTLRINNSNLSLLLCFINYLKFSSHISSKEMEHHHHNQLSFVTYSTRWITLLLIICQVYRSTLHYLPV